MNRADEMARLEKGLAVPLDSINVTRFPESGPVLDVNLEPEGADVKITPVRHSVPRRLDLVHSADDLLAAQISEDPEMTSFTVPGVGPVTTGKSRIQTAITRNQNREQLIWFGIDSANLTAALGDRIVVRRDTLESEHVCKDCKGKGHTEVVCSLCEGRQAKEGLPCKNCVALGFESEKPRPTGFNRCVSCAGSGWKNGIVIPEVAQSKPVTGVVVSLGPATQLLKLGDRVLHSRFAGHTLEMRSEFYTFMREHEVISLLRDL